MTPSSAPPLSRALAALPIFPNITMGLPSQLPLAVANVTTPAKVAKHTPVHVALARSLGLPIPMHGDIPALTIWTVNHHYPLLMTPLSLYAQLCSFIFDPKYTAKMPKFQAQFVNRVQATAAHPDNESRIQRELCLWDIIDSMQCAEFTRDEIVGLVAKVEKALKPHIQTAIAAQCSMRYELESRGGIGKPMVELVQ